MNFFEFLIYADFFKELISYIIYYFCNSDPTPEGKDDPLLPIKWDPITSTKPYQIPYLNINARLDLKHNPEQARMEFWDDLYEQYNGDIV